MMVQYLNSEKRIEFILLSFGFSFIGAYCASILCEQLRLSIREKSKLLNSRILMTMMSISIGGVAIWCKHFIGISAVRYCIDDGTPIEVRHRIDFVLISLTCAVLLCHLGIYCCFKDPAFAVDKVDMISEFMAKASTMTIQELRTMDTSDSLLFKALFKDIHHLIAGGTVTASGVCSMHYLGMEGMVLDADREYDTGLVIAAILLAVTAAIVAYWIFFRLLALYPNIQIFRIISSLVVTAAVFGMHYTAMASVKFVYSEGKASVPHRDTISGNVAMTGAVTSAAIFVFLVLSVVIADLRSRLVGHHKTLKAIDIMMEKMKASNVRSSAVTATLNDYTSLRASGRRSVKVISSEFQQSIRFLFRVLIFKGDRGNHVHVDPSDSNVAPSESIQIDSVHRSPVRVANRDLSVRQFCQRLLGPPNKVETIRNQLITMTGERVRDRCTRSFYL
jgi:NO-binding membrane sensor protein with MHYT domain